MAFFDRASNIDAKESSFNNVGRDQTNIYYVYNLVSTPEHGQVVLYRPGPVPPPPPWDVISNDCSPTDLPLSSKFFPPHCCSSHHWNCTIADGIGYFWSVPWSEGGSEHTAANVGHYWTGYRRISVYTIRSNIGQHHWQRDGAVYWSTTRIAECDQGLSAGSKVDPHRSSMESSGKWMQIWRSTYMARKIDRLSKVVRGMLKGFGFVRLDCIHKLA
jgi:hypothetical protein